MVTAFLEMGWGLGVGVDWIRSVEFLSYHTMEIMFVTSYTLNPIKKDSIYSKWKIYGTKSFPF